MTTTYAPDLTVLNLALQAEAKVEKTNSGYQVTIVVNSHDDLKELEVKAKDVFTAIEDRHELIKKVSEKKGRVRPLSPAEKGKFYPDFVAELADGRILAVEYKGEHLVTAEDAEEKDMIGRLWAARSGGKCLFLMATKRDIDGRDVYAQIASAVGTAKIRGR